jgi:prepilin-type N-terminal cleavage/methylation domain-containing protein
MSTGSPAHAGPPRRHLDEDGFTIVELVVAIAVLLIGLTGATKMMASSILVSGDTRLRVIAANVATETLEQLRGTASDPSRFATIPIGFSTATRTVGPFRFTVETDTEWVGQRANASNCDAGGNQPQILRSNVSVSWTHMRGTKPVESTTTLAPPVGVYSANTGAIAAKLVTASGDPATGVQVSATSATTRTVVTGDDGCAFFAFLPTGTYNVTATAAGWVNDQELVVPSQSTTVSVGSTKSVVFNLDRAATLNVTGWTSSAPAATGIPVSVANTGLQPNGQYVFPAGTTALTPLFPYSDGYSLFAGSCTDANPLGLNASRNPYYPLADADPLDVAPGGVDSGPVTLYPLAVRVTLSNGTVVNGATVSALATGTVCPSGRPTYGLPNSDASGNTTAGVSLGHLTITARSGTKVGTAKVWVKPDGTWAVDGSGNATSKFGGAVTVSVS